MLRKKISLNFDSSVHVGMHVCVQVCTQKSHFLVFPESHFLDSHGIFITSNID